MKLISLSVQGFRPFCDPIEVDFDQLTVFIGNNDSGKSSLIDILDIALDKNKKPDDKDFYTCSNSINAEKIVVVLNFSLEPKDKKALEYAIDNELTFQVIYTKQDVKQQFRKLVPKDKELCVDFKNLKADEQRALIQKYDSPALITATNSDLRTVWYDEFVKSIEKEKAWEDVDRNFQKILPIIQHYNAMDYKSPENIINRTMANVFSAIIYESNEEDGVEEKLLRKSLQEITSEAEIKINQKANELIPHIQKYAPSIKNITYEPSIDFTRGFQGGFFRLNEGQGDHYLDRSGDGTKRKIFMATTDWDREVTLSLQAENEDLPLIIRAYDEPDTNLDYQAQHQLYKSISAITLGENSNIQSIISTHSPRLIDRAPAKSIRMLKVENGTVKVEKLITDEDDEIEKFLSDLAIYLGISNSLIFYERCFIFVEGETEERALPLFYKTLFGSSLLEDGINLINVKGKNAFPEFLRLFSKNKQELTLFLMDSDSEETRDDKLTKQVLKRSGFSDQFCDEKVFLIGEQEFEDSFPKELFVRIFNEKWPKKAQAWSLNDFEEIDKRKKFSKGLSDLLYSSEIITKEKFSKPVLGHALGMVCLESDIPHKIKDLFSEARRISSVVS